MTKTFAGAGFEEPDTIAWTGSEIVVAGFYAGGGTNFGIRTLQLAGGFDIWVAKLNPINGAAVWAVPLASTGDDKYPSLVVDALGDIYVTGFVGAATTFGGFPVGGAGGLDIFVANSDGTQLWTKVIGTSGSDYGSSVANGLNAFYAAVDLASDIGPTVEGVSIVGAAAPVGLLLKIQP